MRENVRGICSLCKRCSVSASLGFRVCAQQHAQVVSAGRVSVVLHYCKVLNSSCKVAFPLP